MVVLRLTEDNPKIIFDNNIFNVLKRRFTTPFYNTFLPPPANDLKLRPLVKIGSLSSINSSNSLGLERDGRKDTVTMATRKEGSTVTMATKGRSINEDAVFHLENNMSNLTVSREDEESTCTVT